MQGNVRRFGVVLALTACGGLLTFAANGGDARKVRLFILSGQSNMVGLIPDVSFTPAVKAAFPNDEVIVVKNAVSGQPIRKWYKQWKPAPGDEMPRSAGIGHLYDSLMASVKTGMQGKAEPASVVFVWMQGEADGKGTGKVYGESLKGVIKQLRDDLKRQDMFVVIGRISDFGNDDRDRPEWIMVRNAQVAVAEADPLAAWIDTDDLNGPANALHYGKGGYQELGKRFAAKAIELVKKGGK